MENLIDENRALRLDEGYFTEIAEDKHVVVEYEKRPGRVVVKFLEEGTGKELSEEFEINGITDDEYKVYPKAIEGYEVVKDKYPQNEKGNITPGDTVVVYYYSAIQEKPDVTPQNPDTVPEKTENPDVTPPSSDTVQENPDMEPEIPADQPNAQDENLYPELYDTSNGTTGVQTGDKVIFSIINSCMMKRFRK